ncbi:MAG: PilC/PilY family type IV pilus protein [Acidithiobacillales bacterium]
MTPTATPSFTPTSTPTVTPTNTPGKPGTWFEAPRSPEVPPRPAEYLALAPPKPLGPLGGLRPEPSGPNGSPLWQGVGAAGSGGDIPGPQIVPPVGAILRLPTPEITPTPGPYGTTGCAGWVYLLHWDRPSRLASLKNALGDSVSINSEYYPPGTNITDNTATPWIVERTADARFNKPDIPGAKPTDPSTPSPYNGAAAGGPPDGSAWGAPSNPNWNSFSQNQSLPPGAAGWFYRQGTDLEGYYSSLPPLGPPLPPQTPTPTPPAAAPTPATGIDVWADGTIHNPLYPYPWGGNVVGNYHLTAYDQFGDQATWAWTLMYGTDSKGNTIYGDDPGPPFVHTWPCSGAGPLCVDDIYDETVLSGLTAPPPAPQPYLPNFTNPYPERPPSSWGTLPDGSSIPGVTGTPKVGFVRVDPPKMIVSKTSDKVNWGLYSFQDLTPYSTTVGDYCEDPNNYGNYQLLQHVYPTDNGKIDQIETALQLVYYGGIFSSGGTPSKEGLRRAGKDLYDNTYLVDPKVPLHCDRPYGLIFCTDGLSNICNPGGKDSDYTGPPATGPVLSSNWNGPSGGEPWTSPCEGYYGFDAGCYTAAVPPGGGAPRLWNCCDPGSKRNGSGFDCNAETMSSDSTEIDHYKDANPVPWNDSDPDYRGFVAGVAEKLFTDGFQLGSDTLTKSHIRTFVIGISPTVGKCELNYTAYRGRSDASAQKGDAGFTYQIVPGVDPGDPRLPQDGQDGTSPNTYAASIGGGDYAFFAGDSQSIYDAFQEIIAGTATGDYATSPPIAGAAVAQGNIVLLPSTNYPTWQGHLRAIDTLKVPGDLGYVRWDAGNVLSNPSATGYITPAQRKIYTWDPANIAGGFIEVQSDAGTQNALAAIAGLPTTTFTRNVLDFIRGNNGTLTDTAREWIFGSSINSTPAVIGRPEIYNGNFAATHAAFEIKYRYRNPVAWVGADDGMLHAFDFNTGQELLALLPPELLARQVTLYKNYKDLLRPSGAHKTETGQNPDIAQHIWGVAQSFRYADVWDAVNGVWKTVGYLTLGPSGSSVAAFDVTHPSPGDPDYDAAKPVQILWQKSSTDLPGLDLTWSVPAVAATQVSPPAFLTIFGAGFNAASTASSQLDSKLFQLQALDGTDGYSTGNKNWVPIQTAPVDPLNKPLVGEQAFAASVFFDTTKPTYYGNNVANLGLQADLNGQIWFNFATGGTVDFDQVKLGIDVPAAIQTIEGGAADQAPLYYPPAASGKGTSGCQVFAFGSGTMYEKSLLVTETSGSAAPAGQQSQYTWSPRLFVAVNDKTTAPFSPAGGPIDASGQRIISKKITDIQLPCCPTTDPSCDPEKNEVNPRCFLKTGDPTTLGPRTQMTAPPFLLVPLSGAGSFQALFLLYDPDAIGYCRGFSYIVVLNFDLTSCNSVDVTTIDVYSAGEGAASGFAMAGTQIVVGKSGIGTGQQAGVLTTPVNILNYGGLGNVTPVYWKELQ